MADLDILEAVLDLCPQPLEVFIDLIGVAAAYVPDNNKLD
jgi:hypothetical protein